MCVCVRESQGEVGNALRDIDDVDDVISVAELPSLEMKHAHDGAASSAAPPLLV